MLFIKAYYYFFAAFIFSLVGICEGLSYLWNMQFHLPRIQRLHYKNIFSLLHLNVGKVH